MSLEYYRNPKDGRHAKSSNLREDYEEREYKPPFHIILCNSKETGEFYKVQDSSGYVICDTWRQGVDAERIVEALNLTYTLKGSNLVDVLGAILRVAGVKKDD